MTGMNRKDAMHRAMEFAHKSGLQGDYFEFGVFEGYSLGNAIQSHAHWAEKMGRPVCERFIAFDSFAGLPEMAAEDRLADYEVFQPGQYACTMEQVRANLEARKVPVDRLMMLPGFFEDSLGSAATQQQLGDGKAAVVHIDCDLQSSAATCLRFLGDRLVDGAVLLFDDWFCYRGRPDCGVHAAFDQWLAGWPGSASEYFRYSWAGMALILHQP